MSPDRLTVTCSKWKQFSVGINPKISLSEERASHRVRVRCSSEGENQWETWKGKERQ